MFIFYIEYPVCIFFFLCVQFTGDQVQAAHGDHCITQHASFDQFGISLVINEAWAAEMKPVGRSATIADQIKAQFTIGAFH